MYSLQIEVDNASPPEGFESAEYHMVTGAMQGKYGYEDGALIDMEGNQIAVSEIEQKIASIHGGK